MGCRQATRTIVAVLVGVALASSAALSHAGDTSGGHGIYVPAVVTPWPGKIFVAHDEWALSDYGYAVSRPSARQLTLNLANWFTGGRPGRFLVYSAFYALTGQEIAATMTAAGHTWTVDMSVPFTLSSLLQYDAVFVGGQEVDNSVLIDYVRSGGNVFVEGGTGLGGNIYEAADWNVFLQAFGLAFADDYDYSRAAGIYTMTSTSSLFNGVTQLYEDTGNPILKLDPSDPNVQILVPYNGHALYASYSTKVIPVTVEACHRLSRESNGLLAVAIAGTPDVDVRTIDPGSVRVLNVTAAMAGYGYDAPAAPGPRLGKAALDACQPVSDRSLDLVFGFRNRELLASAEAILGLRLSDGDLVALILTGRLKPEFGGTPIVGESIVAVKRPRRPTLSPR
jgi:hypothetical protein